MSAAGEVDSVSIALPQGGGAIRGIGETFQPSAFDGTGAFSVPIPVSPGRAGLEPELRLTYSSGNGNGVFGLGWALSIPNITRKTEKGLPRYDGSDVFVLSGVEDLVPTPGGPYSGLGNFSVRAFRPRVEGLFARIEQWTNANGADTHWRVTTRDNITSLYGRTPQARITNPADPQAVFQWLLEETFDSKGNHLLYTYASDDPALPAVAVHDTHRTYSQRYLRRIYYGNLPSTVVDAAGTPLRNVDGSLVGIAHPASDPADPTITIQRSYAFEVVFDYGDWSAPDDPAAQEIGAGGYQPASTVAAEQFSAAVPQRPDPFSSFRAGFEVRTLRRCRRILAYHHLQDDANQLLVKATHLAFRKDPHSELSLLEAVTVAGTRRKAGVPQQLVQRTLPPIRFGYTAFQPGQQRFKTITAPEGALPPASLQHPEFALVDLFGDGIPDVLHAGDAGYRYWRNLGEGRLELPRTLPTVPAGLSLAKAGVGLADVDGDGRAELLVQSGPLQGFFESTPQGGWENFRAISRLPSVAPDDPRLRQVDLTGDGQPDLLLTHDHHFRWFQCLGEEGYLEQPAIERIQSLDEFPDVQFDDPSGRVRLADMSGDGLTDIVLVHQGRVDYWPNLGYGRFGKRITMGAVPQPPDLDALFDPARLFLADLDGSGCADLVYVGADQVHFWFNRSGNGWSDRQVIAGTPFTPSGAAVAFADLFGTGTATLVWSRDLGTIPGGNYFALDFCGGTKPYLLVEMDNQMGAATRVQYAPSTRFALADAAAGTPWHTQLPFPVHVVEKVEVLDRISRTRHTTTYRYRHGYFDGREREFRGFGCVEQEDTEVFDDFATGTIDGAAALNTDGAFHVPPVHTRTWFHTGAWMEAGSLGDRMRTEFWQGDAAAPRLGAHEVTDDPEALRALRGAVLRTEVFGLDQPLDAPGSKAAHPYTVTEYRYRVRTLQAAGVASGIGSSHAVHHMTQAETLTAQYERNPADPRVAHAITFAPDAFGNITDSFAIAYPRRRPDPAVPEQGERKLVYTKADHAINATPAGAWLGGIAAQTRVFELQKVRPARPDGLYQESDFAGLTADLRAPFATGSWLAFHDTPPPATPSKRLVQWSRIYFRKDADAASLDAPGTRASRLPLGVVEPLALPYETLQAVLTDSLVTDVYAGRVDAPLLQRGGYVREAGVPGHWWVPSAQAAFDPARFFATVQTRDAFGNLTALTHDPYALLPESVTDALGNRTLARNDYRVLQPDEVTSPNGHVAQAAFDALGRVAGTALRARTGEGDSLAGFEPDPTAAEISAFFSNPRLHARALLASASSRLVYDLHAFSNLQTPVSHATVAREEHASLNTNPALAISLSYSDGFGRDVQAKVQAEPDPANPGARWVTSGWTVYNNKGKPVRQFEPFFSPTHAFDFNIRHGVSPTLFYDPLGRAIGTLRPDRSWEKVVFDPWRQESHDAHDTVLVADPRGDPDLGPFFQRLPAAEWSPTWHASRINSADPAAKDAAQKAAAHAGTPSVLHFDGLARPVLAVANAGGGQLLRTHSNYDIQGNVTAITDPRGIAAFTHAFDMTGRPLSVDSVDAGLARMLPDAGGAPLASWDANGHQVLVKADALRRPTERWVRLGAGSHRLSQVTLYGEAAGAAALAGNLRGQVWKVYDGAGLQEHQRFDFKGNLLRSTRTLMLDAMAQPAWGTDNDPWRHVFDESAARARLDTAQAHTIATAYDALNRAVASTSPDGSVQQFGFNQTGLLTAVQLRHRGAALAKSMVDRIDYDAKGQRTRIAYGNGVVTEHFYDTQTFRLVRLRTQRAAGARRLLQDLSYTYDAVGNITRIEDGAHQRAWFANQAVDPVSSYRYDAVYRLAEASGREHVALGPCHHSDGGRQQTEFIALTAGGQPVANAQALANYTEVYTYDDSGNLTGMQHLRGATTLWTRKQTIDTGSNRLLRSDAGCAGEQTPLQHDANGNLLNLAHLPQLRWDDRNQLTGMDLNVAANPDTLSCQYDAMGQRLRKTTSRQGSNRVEHRIYLGGIELFLVRGPSGVVERWETLHISDGAQRIALLETQTAPTDASRVLDTLTRMQLGNHLGSAVLEIDDSPAARVISYEEFTPYGETAYLAGANLTEVRRKRYRYSGKERDSESGLCYYGARYLAPWVGRWLSCDPLGAKDSMNLFQYVQNSPMRFADPGGTESIDIANPVRPEPVFSKKLRQDQLPQKTKDAYKLLHKVNFEPVITEGPLGKRYERRVEAPREHLDETAAQKNMHTECVPTTIRNYLRNVIRYDVDAEGIKQLIDAKSPILIEWDGDIRSNDTGGLGLLVLNDLIPEKYYTIDQTKDSSEASFLQLAQQAESSGEPIIIQTDVHWYLLEGVEVVREQNIYKVRDSARPDTQRFAFSKISFNGEYVATSIGPELAATQLKPATPPVNTRESAIDSVKR